VVHFTLPAAGTCGSRYLVGSTHCQRPGIWGVGSAEGPMVVLFVTSEICPKLNNKKPVATTFSCALSPNCVVLLIYLTGS